MPWLRFLKMLKIVLSNRFRKDLKLAQKRGLDLDLLMSIVNALASGKVLDLKYRDHDLSGIYAGFRECHIQPDWLLIYKITESVLVLSLVRTGSHSRLFRR
jgi:mRNA interferase YafQ